MLTISKVFAIPFYSTCGHRLFFQMIVQVYYLLGQTEWGKKVFFLEEEGLGSLV